MALYIYILYVSNGKKPGENFERTGKELRKELMKETGNAMGTNCEWNMMEKEKDVHIISWEWYVKELSKKTYNLRKKLRSSWAEIV